MIALLLWAAGTANADTILYCNDYNLSTDRMASALSSYSTHTITTTTNLSTCESYIRTGSYDLVILAVQNASASTPYYNARVLSGQGHSP